MTTIEPPNNEHDEQTDEERERVVRPADEEEGVSVVDPDEERDDEEHNEDHDEGAGADPDAGDDGP